MTTKTEALKQALEALTHEGISVAQGWHGDMFRQRRQIVIGIINAALAEPEWLPIDSAPKDGTNVLGYGEPAGEIHGPSGVMTIESMVWSSSRTDFPGYEWVIAGDGYANWFKPTHWQPLPKAPA